MTKKRVATTTETMRETTITIRLGRRPASGVGRCRLCGGQMLELNALVRSSGCDWKEIVGGVARGAVHAAETPGGELYVCASSLAAAVSTGLSEMNSTRGETK